MRNKKESIWQQRRKTIGQKYSNIQDEIEQIIGSSTSGNPENILLWTTKSLRNIERALGEKGFDISHDTIGIAI